MRQAGADAMRGVMHRRQSFPITGPAIHVLEMRAAQELDAAELARVAQFADVKEFARIDDRLHHHVILLRLLRGFDDLFAFFDRRGGGHGAGDMFAGLQGGDALRRVQMDGGIDVDRIDIRVLEQVFEAGVTLFDAVLVADLVQLFLGALADGVHVGVGMALVNGDEFRSEPEADDGHIDFFIAHRFRIYAGGLIMLRNNVHGDGWNEPVARESVNRKLHKKPYFQVVLTRTVRE